MKKLFAAFLIAFCASAHAADDGLVLAAATTNPGIGTINSADQLNPAHRGVKVVIDITAIGGGATLTVTIKGKDPVSGKYFVILASTALAATSTTVLTIFPGATAAANATVNDQLPRTWRVESAVGSANNITYTIAAIKLD
jgi:hypothetical protein